MASPLDLQLPCSYRLSFRALIVRNVSMFITKTPTPPSSVALGPRLMASPLDLQ